MKLVYILMLVLLNFNTCNAQKTTEIMMPEITKEFEEFDILHYNKIKHTSFTQEIKNESLYIYIDSKSGYSISKYPINSFFSITKNYFPNKKIEIKGVSFNNGSEYGIWYEFDEQGNLIKEINTDEGYTFAWEQIIEYCEDNKIELTKGYVQGGYQTNIFKEELEGKKVWVISHLLSPILISKKTLDGITGELIKEEELEFINH